MHRPIIFVGHCFGGLVIEKVRLRLNAVTPTEILNYQLGIDICKAS